MGVDKFRNLILTVREDHFPDSPSHARGGPKIHFDLAGYDILKWSPHEQGAFRGELETQIRPRRRRAIPTRCEQKGYLRRVVRIGQTNRFNLTPLFDVLRSTVLARRASTKKKSTARPSVPF